MDYTSGGYPGDPGARWPGAKDPVTVTDPGGLTATEFGGSENLDTRGIRELRGAQPEPHVLTEEERLRALYRSDPVDPAAVDYGRTVAG